MRGVLIAGVKADSDAGEKGLVKGDVLSSVNGMAVNSTSEVANAISAAQKGGRTSVLAKVVRQGRPVFVPLKIAP